MILLPRVEQRVQPLKIFLNGTRIDSGLTVDEIASDLDGTLPADLPAICTTAKWMAFNRLTDGDLLPPNRSNFDRAIQCVLGNDAQSETRFHPFL